MEEDQLNDLKQFITATVSQATAEMVTKDDLRNELAKGLNSLHAEIRTEMNQRFDEVQAAISDIITSNNDSVDTQLEDHEQRLTKLEQQTA